MRRQAAACTGRLRLSSCRGECAGQDENQRHVADEGGYYRYDDAMPVFRS
jgi:hypothetical protein